MKKSIAESDFTWSNAEYKNLSEYLHKEKGFKLSAYRVKYVERRITSRLHATGCSSVSDYLCLLKKDQKEVAKLYDVLTINVSSFFRNKEVFDFLKEHIFPKIAESKIKSGETSINIRSIGCSTGEEPYSIAILIYRYLRIKLQKFNITIEAVDIDPKVLDIAKNGVYPHSKLENLDPKIIRTCFKRVDERYQLSEIIREMVKFKQEDIVKLKPAEMVFDLVLCRNMLIYFSKEKHAMAYNYFLRLLHIGGYLILGKAEVMFFPKENHFDYVSIKNRVYQKIS